MTNKSIYLPGLNGIRAIAAIAVVISHLTLSFDKYGLNESLFGKFSDGQPKPLDLAEYGVTLFFALSGFLITFLLLKEKEISKVSLKKFYARRVLRIWPLYYSYLIICIITYLLFNIDFAISSLPYYIFHSANLPIVIGGTLPLLVHFWSLGVEEQFYLLWPWVTKLKLNQITLVTTLGIILIVGVKAYLHFYIPNSRLEFFIDVTRVQCMMIGALAAIAYYTNYSPFLKFAKNKLTQLICWAILLIVLINRFHVSSLIDHEILSLITVIIIIGQVTKSSPINLENRYFDFLGKISYGIYVIHPLIIFLLSKVLKDITTIVVLNYIIAYTSVLLTTILLSHLSYNYFETRFLKLKGEKFSVVRSRGSVNDRFDS